MRERSTEELQALLGIQNGTFPFFNSVIHDLGMWPDEIEDFESKNKIEDETELLKHGLRNLRPRWHQYVGLAACVKRFFDRKNVILADGVGVGKTMQCLMIMAYLRHLRVVYKQRGLPNIGEQPRT